MQKTDADEDANKPELQGLARSLKGISHDLFRLAGALLADQSGRLLPEAIDERQRGGRVAERLYRDRRMRAKILPKDLFGEPAWDILLDLYVASHLGRPVSVTEAALAAEIPGTTSLRWLKILEVEGLLERLPDPKDGRRSFIRLSIEGEQAMTSYLIKLET